MEQWHSVKSKSYVKDVKVNKKETPAEELQDNYKIVGEIRASGKYPKRYNDSIIGVLDDNVDVLKVDTYGRYLYKRNKLFIRVGEEREYISIVRRRVLPILGIILCILAVFELVFWLITGQNAAENTINYVGSATGLTQPNADVHGEVTGYTSFVSTPDVTWSLSDTEHSISIQNVDGNEVDLCPHIYIDVNGDGDYTEDECYYNPIIYNSDGSVKSYGDRLAPGNSITSVTLSKDLDLAPGTYNARVSYTSFMAGTDDMANGMNMPFVLTITE